MLVAIFVGFSIADWACASSVPQSDHQKLMKIMQPRIAASLVVHALPATGKLVHGIPTARRFHSPW
jgi:hypothetical protein